MLPALPPDEASPSLDPELPARLQASLEGFAQHALDSGHLRAAQLIRQTAMLLAEPYVWDRPRLASRRGAVAADGD